MLWALAHSPQDAANADIMKAGVFGQNYQHAQVLLAVCTHGAIVERGLFLLQAVGQREQSPRSLPALCWCMTVHFLSCQIEMYFSGITPDSSWEMWSRPTVLLFSTGDKQLYAEASDLWGDNQPVFGWRYSDGVGMIILKFTHK